MSKNVLAALEMSDNNQAAMTEVVGMVVIDKDLLSNISGGMAMPSSGYICTYSAECNGGSSCNPFYP